MKFEEFIEQDNGSVISKIANCKNISDFKNLLDKNNVDVKPDDLNKYWNIFSNDLTDSDLETAAGGSVVDTDVSGIAAKLLAAGMPPEMVEKMCSKTLDVHQKTVDSVSKKKG